MFTTTPLLITINKISFGESGETMKIDVIKLINCDIKNDLFYDICFKLISFGFI